jgi:hypothetical protein
MIAVAGSRPGNPPTGQWRTHRARPYKAASVRVGRRTIAHDLPRHESNAKGRAIRVDHADEASRDLNRIKHRRRLRSVDSARLSSLPRHGVRISLRVAIPGLARIPPRVSRFKGERSIGRPVHGNRQGSQRPDSIAAPVRMTCYVCLWPVVCSLKPVASYDNLAGLSRNPSSFRDRTGCWSLRMALASTWRTRSRVTLKILPTSSSV